MCQEIAECQEVFVASAEGTGTRNKKSATFKMDEDNLSMFDGSSAQNLNEYERSRNMPKLTIGPVLSCPRTFQIESSS